MNQIIRAGLICVLITEFSKVNAAQQTVSDSFDRTTAAQTSVSSPNLIGTNYTIASGTWLTSSGSPGYLQSDAPGIMLDTTLALNNDFTLSLKALHPNYTIAQGARQAGVVLNYQDANNYYVIRWGNQTDGILGNIQIAKYVSGVGTTIGVVSNLAMAGGIYYDWKVSGSGNTISYSVTATNSTTPIYSGSFIDSTFSGGYAGFYRFGGGTVRFDDYSLGVSLPKVLRLVVFSSAP